MINTKKQAAEDIKRLANMMRGLITLAPDLDQAGDLERSIEIMTARVEKLKADAAAEQAAVENANVALAEAQAMIGDLYQSVEPIKARAQDEARVIVDKAKMDGEASAKAAIAAAQQSIDAMQARAQQNIDAMRAAFTVAKSEVGAANHDLADIRAQIKARQGDLDNLNAHIADVKAKIANLA